ncbi:MAG: hypothetical protein ACOYBE_09540 [Blautia sp.]|jgi:multidrug resistance efflux pump
MSIKKKVVISVVSVLLVISLVTGGIIAARNANAKTVLVVPVSNMSMGMYNEESIEGQVATSVTQKVKLDKDSIIEKVYVAQGDHVRRGDKLITFDMTLKEMELEIAVLTKQQQQQNLKKAKERLASLQNGGPIEEEEGETNGPSTLPGSGSDEDKPKANSLFGENTGEDPEEPNDLDPSEEPGGNIARTNESGTESSAVVYGIAMPPLDTDHVTAAAFPSLISFEPETGETPGFTPEDPSGEEEITPTPSPTPTETPAGDEKNKFYTVLDSIEEKHSGTGTKEDPFVFLCSSATGEVTVKGSFLNEAAGYDAEGVELLKEGGYWFRLEFHKDDKLDEEDGSKSLIGYYVRNGGLLTNPVDPKETSVYTLDHATDPGMDLDPDQVITPTPTPEPEPEEPGDDDWGDDWDDDGGDDSGMTREQAIKEQKRQINELEIQIKASDIKISRLQRSLDKKTVVSAVNGTVTKMGDPVTGTYEGDAFMEIQSDGGFYVKGSISELMLESIKEGDVLNCTSYETGNSFQAEITEISQYPGNSSGYYGSGNTNSSFYPFIAVVSDDVQLSNGEGVNILLSGSQAGMSDSIDIAKAFVRSENGQYYVYKDDNGKLKKQIVEAKVSTDGYSVKILSGLTMEDKIAFPYGKEVTDGAKTREGSMDELYGAY